MYFLLTCFQEHVWVFCCITKLLVTSRQPCWLQFLNEESKPNCPTYRTLTTLTFTLWAKGNFKVPFVLFPFHFKMFASFCCIASEVLWAGHLSSCVIFFKADTHRESRWTEGNFDWPWLQSEPKKPGRHSQCPLMWWHAPSLWTHWGHDWLQRWPKKPDEHAAENTHTHTHTHSPLLEDQLCVCVCVCVCVCD